MRSTTLVLLLIALTAATSWAVPVNPNGPAGIAATWNSEGNPTSQVFVLSTAGELWALDLNSDPPAWLRGPLSTDPTQLDVPVPVADIADWWLYGLVTHSGEVWGFDSSVPQGWQLCPPPPFGPIGARPESMGGVKQRFR